MKYAKQALITLLLLISFHYALPQPKELTLESLFSDKRFNGRGLNNVQWIDDGNKFSFLRFDSSMNYSIYQHDISTGKETVLISGNDLKIDPEDDPFTIRNYTWSPDKRYLLFTGILPARSLKTGGTFYIYDIERRRFFVRSESNEDQVNIQFSPDSKKLGFVRGNNLFVVDIESGTEKQLTFDGNENILNGIFDWVYEEEFSIIQGWEWSPDSKMIGFWRLDQTEVPEIKIQKWDSLYLNTIDMKYPKPGAKNAQVKIGAVDVNTTKITWIDIGKQTDIYIPRIKFTANPGILSVQRLNRLQNKLDLLFADINTGRSNVVLSETNNEGWVPVEDDLTFLKDQKHFIWPSEKDGYLHLYLYDYTGKFIRQITKGSWEITGVKGVDEENQIIYYTSNERGTIYNDLYSINFSGSAKKLITERKGTHSVNISTNRKFFIDKYSNSNQLAITNLFNISGEKIRELIHPDMSFIKEYGLTQIELVKFTTSAGFELQASIIKPPDFDELKKYPVLIDNYSGPGSQIVSDTWQGFDYMWHSLLAKKGYIVFSFDNRGTGGRGRAFKNLVYKNLGQLEVEDMIEAAKYLSSLSFVDSKRIGIWGWSYGGYISALTILKAPDYFKTAIAVAPVTHWKFYDSIYTERYMQSPELNPEGYERSSPLNYADKLKGNLLIIHGTCDDNVHFQNSVKLIEKLIENNKPFRTMFYPEKNHGIHGGLTRQHLYILMTNFIVETL